MSLLGMLMVRSSYFSDFMFVYLYKYIISTYTYRLNLFETLKIEIPTKATNFSITLELE